MGNWHLSQQEPRRKAIKTTIKAVYQSNRVIYGYRRIDAFLRFILNTKVGDRLVPDKTIGQNHGHYINGVNTEVTYVYEKEALKNKYTDENITNTKVPNK